MTYIYIHKYNNYVKFKCEVLLLLFIARNKKNFGSGQLVFENWSSGPVEIFFFFEPQHKSSKSYFSTSLKS